MAAKKVEDYKVTPLHFDDKLATAVAARRQKGESVAAIAQALKIGAGKVAMAELVNTTERAQVDDPAALARAVARDRKAGKSWGWLSARYGITEGTARAAYEAATGQAFSSLDYRRRAAQEG